MTNISPVWYDYEFERASTNRQSMAAQVLYLTENLRRLQNQTTQFRDVYDVPGVAAGTISWPLGVSGLVQIVQNGNPANFVFTSNTAVLKMKDGATTTPSFTWTSNDRTKITIVSTISTAIYQVTGKHFWGVTGTGVASAQIYTSTGIKEPLYSIPRTYPWTTAGVLGPAAGFAFGYNMLFQKGSTATYVQIKVAQNSGTDLTVGGNTWLHRIT